MVRKIYWEDFEAGHVEWGAEVVADKDEMLAYARKYDPWPFHVDEAAAAETHFEGLIASGGYTVSLWYLSGKSIWFRDDQEWAFLGGHDWRIKFLLPVRPGDRLRAKWTLLEKIPSSKPGRGLWRNRIEFVNQNDDVAMAMETVAMLATRPGSRS